MKLGNTENIPDVLYYELSQFDHKFGFVANNIKRLQKPNAYSHMWNNIIFSMCVLVKLNLFTTMLTKI